jgi:hypothetical protein
MEIKNKFIQWYREAFEAEPDFEDITRITMLSVFEAGHNSNACPNEAWECTKIQRRLEAEIGRKDKALQEILNYLHHRTDDLCGDDCVGDKKLTASFNAKVKIIEMALADTK